MIVMMSRKKSLLSFFYKHTRYHLCNHIDNHQQAATGKVHSYPKHVCTQHKVDNMHNRKN